MNISHENGAEARPGVSAAAAFQVLEDDLRAGVMADEVQEAVVGSIIDAAWQEEDVETAFQAAGYLRSGYHAVQTMALAEEKGRAGSLAAALDRAAAEPDPHGAYMAWSLLSTKGVEEAGGKAFLAAQQIEPGMNRLFAFEHLAENGVPGAGLAAFDTFKTLEQDETALHSLLRMADKGHPLAFAAAADRVANATRGYALEYGMQLLAEHRLAKEPANQELLLAKALDLAKKVEREQDSYRSGLFQVAGTATRAEDMTAATEAAEAITDPVFACNAWIMIAEKTGERADLDKAYGSIARIPGDIQRASHLVSLAKLGHPTALQEATAIMQAMDTRTSRIYNGTWADIAELNFAAGRIEEAVAFGNHPDELVKETVRGRVAELSVRQVQKDPAAIDTVYSLYRDENMRPYIRKSVENMARETRQWGGEMPLRLMAFVRAGYVAEPAVRVMLGLKPDKYS